MSYRNIRLLIVEDHATMRDGLKRIFEKVPEVSAIGAVADTVSALRALRGPDWDALLIDLMSQGCRGVDVVAAARATRPKLPILALCRHGHDQCAARAAQRRLGLRRSRRGPRGADARVSARRARGRYVSPSLPEWIRDGGSPDPPAAHESLSNREHQIFRMITAGSTPTQIASELSLSAKTVDTHRVRILKKLGLRSSAELMRYALANGLVQ